MNGKGVGKTEVFPPEEGRSLRQRPPETERCPESPEKDEGRREISAHRLHSTRFAYSWPLFSPTRERPKNETLNMQRITPYISEILNHLKTHRLFWLSVIIAIIAAVVLRMIWNSLGDHNLVSQNSVDLAVGLVLLNFILAVIALPREPYASTLLVGAALIEELLVIIFLYQV